MTKKQMESRIADLESVVATLSAAINAMCTHAPVYVGPIPTQPTINPFPMPYAGDPSYPWQLGGPWCGIWGGQTGVNGLGAVGGSNIGAQAQSTHCYNSAQER